VTVVLSQQQSKENDQEFENSIIDLYRNLALNRLKKRDRSLQNQLEKKPSSHCKKNLFIKTFTVLFLKCQELFSHDMSMQTLRA